MRLWINCASGAVYPQPHNVQTARRDRLRLAAEPISGPDASSDAHKGQGHQVQIMETFTPWADETRKDPALDLITHLSVQSACGHDTHALLPAIADTKVRAGQGLGRRALLGHDEGDGLEPAQSRPGPEGQGQGPKGPSGPMGAPLAAFGRCQRSNPPLTVS
jgi:hypothetical protein